MRKFREIEELPPDQQGFVVAWRPISTAPRDGTRILLAGRWPITGNWAVAEGQFLATRFSFVGDGATHWMPMPTPPRILG